MQLSRWIALAVCAGLFAGCSASADKGPAAQNQPEKPAAAPEDPTARIKANLAKLNDEDREWAETQQFCVVHRDHRLGAMGVPVKITIKKANGKTEEVFLCCAACEAEARKDEAKTAAVAEELYIQGTLAKLSPEDRKLAEAEELAARPNSRLGSMDVPVKYIIKDKDGEHPIFVCCGGCLDDVKKDEPGTLRVVEEMKKKNAVALPPRPQ